MALDCICLKLLALPTKNFRLWGFPRPVLTYKIYFPQHFREHLRGRTAMYRHWPQKVSSSIKNQMCTHKPLLTTVHYYNWLGEVGLKYNSNNKRSCIKAVNHQDIVKGKGHYVLKGVNKAIEEKRIKLRKTKEGWKQNSQMIIADIKETKSKMKEKLEEIVERENVWTIPNVLCVSRIVISPYLGYLILDQNYHWALAVLLVAGVTDLLDGWIARSFKGQSSKIGSFLDPMADKILVATMFLTLTYSEIIPVALTGLIISRDIILVAAGIIIRYKSLPPPRTLSRYFDVTHATAQLNPTFISKVNTMVQLVAVASTLAAPVFGYLDHPALQGLWYLTAGTTIASAGSYLLNKNTFKFLKKT